jgi:hypothetical protein
VPGRHLVPRHRATRAVGPTRRRRRTRRRRGGRRARPAG